MKFTIMANKKLAFLVYLWIHFVLYFQRNFIDYHHEKFKLSMLLVFQSSLSRTLF
jgi:hypothetical protein